MIYPPPLLLVWRKAVDCIIAHSGETRPSAHIDENPLPSKFVVASSAGLLPIKNLIFFLFGQDRAVAVVWHTQKRWKGSFLSVDEGSIHSVCRGMIAVPILLLARLSV